MADELVHDSAGVKLTATEDDAITRHKFNNQATGDLLKAIDATHLARLAIGSTGDVLGVVGGLPVWGAALPTTNYAMVHPTANQSINSESTTKVTLGVEDADPGNHFAASRYTGDKDGRYLILMQAWLVGLADGKLLLTYLYKNGAAIAVGRHHSGHASDLTVPMTYIADLVATDYIEMYVRHTHGSARDLVAAYTYFHIHLLSA